jgi:hypothetical protein
MDGSGWGEEMIGKVLSAIRLGRFYETGNRLSENAALIRAKASHLRSSWQRPESLDGL